MRSLLFALAFFAAQTGWSQARSNGLGFCPETTDGHFVLVPGPFFDVLFEVRVCPNPGSDFLTVATDFPDDLVFKIYSVYGQIEQNGPLAEPQIDLQSLSSGAHILQIVSPDGLFFHQIKFIKQ